MFKFVFHLQALSLGTAKSAHIDLENFIIDFILIWICPLFPDLYVFGVGDVHKDDMNGLVSQRDQEQYFFMLPDLDKVQETFDNMIGTVAIIYRFNIHFLYNIYWFILDINFLPASVQFKHGAFRCVMTPLTENVINFLVCVRERMH